MATNTINNAAGGKTATGTTIGLVAGEGKLPGILARTAKNNGYRVVALALSENAQAAVLPHCDRVHLVAPGQVGRNINLLKKEQADSIVFIGKVPKLNLLHNLHKFDWLAVKELSKMPDFSDDTIQQCIAGIAEAHGVRVRTQAEFLRELFPQVGLITRRQPTAMEYADVQYGMRIAKEIARIDIGQTVVVKNQMIVAIEAIEGTDETIKRAVQLARGPVVVCKVARQDHDPRFDTPTVGMNTLQSMVAPTPGGVLAVGAGETLIVEREEMIGFAEQNGIAIVAV